MGLAEILSACLFPEKRFVSTRCIRLSWFGEMMRITGLVPVLALGGCSHPPPLGDTSGTSLVSAERAYAFPAPGGPSITGVIERRFANATQQDITLATSAGAPGQNLLRIQMFGPVDSSRAGQGRLREGYLPIGDVGFEMRQALPGIRMQRSPFYVQNKYGPFGYAVGRSASGDTCLFAWQRISSTGVTQTWIGNKGSVQVRLRLCDQRASEQRLLKVMYDYTITSFFKTRNWNPYGEPPSPDASLGRPGHPIYPLGVAGLATVTAAASAKPVPRIVRQHVAAVQKPEPSPPQPVGQLVPAPPGGKTAQVRSPVLDAGQPTANPAAIESGATTIVPPPPPCALAGASAGCSNEEDRAH